MKTESLIWSSGIPTAVGEGSKETVTHQWRVGDLAYRAIYKGQVKPANVFRVLRIDGDTLIVNYSDIAQAWDFPPYQELVMQRTAAECLPISEKEYEALVASMHPASHT